MAAAEGTADRVSATVTAAWRAADRLAMAADKMEAAGETADMVAAAGGAVDRPAYAAESTA